MPEHKVKSLLVQEVDPRKAVMTIDLELIDVTCTHSWHQLLSTMKQHSSSR